MGTPHSILCLSVSVFVFTRQEINCKKRVLSPPGQKEARAKQMETEMSLCTEGKRVGRGCVQTSALVVLCVREAFV